MYDQIARFYDLSHADLSDDLEFLLELARQAGGPVLELGCGTGRVLLPLARAGLQITGVDNSPAMLAQARRKLVLEPDQVQATVTLVEADMTDLALSGEDGRYALALVTYNTFMHLEPVQMARALRQVRRYLGVDGRLFLDLANPFAIAQTTNDHALLLENSLTDPDTGDLILQLARNHLDDASQTLHITWVYDMSPTAGGQVQRTIVQFAYHYLYPHQLEIVLNEAGFHLEILAGNYDQSPFREDSDRLLILAQLR